MHYSFVEMYRRLDMDRIEAAAQLCTLVFKCDLPLLRRFLAAGIPVDSGACLNLSGAEG